MSKHPTEDLLLYCKSTCPFCTKVINYLDEIELIINKVDISNSDALKEDLIAIGGKKQVPCLIIDGSPLYESLDIINWLKKNYA